MPVFLQQLFQLFRQQRLAFAQAGGAARLAQLQFFRRDRLAEHYGAAAEHPHFSAFVDDTAGDHIHARFGRNNKCPAFQLTQVAVLGTRALGEDQRPASLTHRDYLAGGPLEYMAAIFRRLTDTDEEAMQLALDFYGPMYLLYSVYDAAEEKETVAPMLAAHIRRFIARIETGYRWNGETDFEGGERLL